MTHDLLGLRLRFEHDVVIARQRARTAARLLGFGNQGQTRVATVVSELARRAFRSGEQGAVEYGVDTDAERPALVVRVRHPTPDDRDGEMRDLEEVLEGARRLLDRAEATTEEGVTSITVWHRLPDGASTATSDLDRVASTLRDQSPNNPFEELQRQNEELVDAMAALREQERERTRLLEAERRAREEAQAAVRSREEILSIVSHDLRNPIGAIQTGARFLLEEPELLDGRVGRRQLQAIVRSAERAERLIQDLLDLSSIDQGTLAVEPEPVEVEALLADLRELMGGRVSDAGMHLELCAEDDLPPVCGDRDRVVQALANLVSNAVRFTPEGGTIRVDASRVGTDTVVLSVVDTGPGVPEGDRDRLFDRFWTNGGAGGGAGLGLAIVRAIAESHGGRAWHDPEGGPGACFRISLPAVGDRCGEGSEGV